MSQSPLSSPKFASPGAPDASPGSPEAPKSAPNLSEHTPEVPPGSPDALLNTPAPSLSVPNASPNPPVSVQNAPASTQNALQALQIDNKNSAATRAKVPQNTPKTAQTSSETTRASSHLSPPNQPGQPGQPGRPNQPSSETTLPSRLTWDDQGAMSRLARFLTPPMLLAVIVAVTWPSGAQVADLKENVGPWFLNAIGKDVVLNLIMLLPLGCLVMGGWPKVSPWKWCLSGFGLGALAETIQWLFPALHRRALIDNVFQNGIGACLGVGLALLIMWALQRKSR